METKDFWERHPILNVYVNFWTRMTMCLLPILVIGGLIEHGFTFDALVPTMGLLLIGQIIMPLLHLIVIAFLGNFI